MRLNKNFHLERPRHQIIQLNKQVKQYERNIIIKIQKIQEQLSSINFYHQFQSIKTENYTGQQASTETIEESFQHRNKILLQNKPPETIFNIVMKIKNRN